MTLMKKYIKNILWEFKNTTIKDKKELAKYENYCVKRILEKVVGNLDKRVTKLEEFAFKKKRKR